MEAICHFVCLFFLVKSIATSLRKEGIHQETGYLFLFLLTESGILKEQYLLKRVLVFCLGSAI